LGHKTHPIGFRLGIIKEWDSKWFAARPEDYRRTLIEDLRLRQTILSWYDGASIAKVEIERSSQEINVAIFTARPGIVIGRQGQRIDELRKALEVMAESKIRLSVQEVRVPELSAVLVARNVGEQLERRVAHRRAILQAANRTMQAGAQGIKIIVRGRLGGAEIARSEKVMLGRVPLHTLRANIDFAVGDAHTIMGRVGVKVWIYTGDVIPAREQIDLEDLNPIEVTLRSDEESVEVQNDATE